MIKLSVYLKRHVFIMDLDLHGLQGGALLGSVGPGLKFDLRSWIS